MYLISYDDKLKFVISFKGYMERDDFIDSVSYLKSLFLSFDSSTNYWVIDEKRIDEILMWFKRHKKEYEITDQALNEVEKLTKTRFKREIQYYRTRQYEDNLLNDNFKPIPKQHEIIEWCLARNAYINACDTGIGKTPLTIYHIEYLYKYNLCDKFIIVVPLGTGYNWEYQFKTFAGYTDDDFGYVSNENKIKPFAELKDKKVIIISNHIFAKVILSYKKGVDLGKSLKSERWSKVYCDLKKELNVNTLGIVLDEVHNFKHSTSIKTKALMSIKSLFDYRFLLTATPNINKFEHIYTQAKFVDKSIIPLSENAFKIDISYSIGNKFDKYGINAYNPYKVEEYRNKLQDILIQVMKTEIPEFKIKKVVSPVYNKMHPLQIELYKKVCEKEINRLQEEFDTVTWQQILNKFPMMLKVIDCPSVLKKSVYDDEDISRLIDKWRLEYDSKYIQLKTILENDIEELDEKVIIFDSSPDILDLLYNEFKKYNPLIIHGSLPDIKNIEKDREHKTHLFNTDKKYKLFLLSTHTSSSALNLQQMCNRVIFYSSPQDATEYRQAQDRVYRITSTKDVSVKVFVYPETIDNVRYMRAQNRVELNDKLSKEISQDELAKLLRGIL